MTPVLYFILCTVLSPLRRTTKCFSRFLKFITTQTMWSNGSVLNTLVYIRDLPYCLEWKYIHTLYTVHIPGLHPLVRVAKTCLLVMSCIRKNYRGGVSHSPRSKADCTNGWWGHHNPTPGRKLLEEIVVRKGRKRLG